MTLSPLLLAVFAQFQCALQIVVVADAFELVLALEQADRKAQPRAPHAQVRRLVHVGIDAAAERADLRLQSELAHVGHGEAVFLAARHRAGFDLVDAEAIERARDRDLGGAVEHDAGLLFAVAQRAIGNEDASPRRDARACNAD